MRKPLEKAAKVLLRNPKFKRVIQTTRDQSVAVQPNHSSPRSLPVEPLAVECPFKARQSPFNVSATVERELGSLKNSNGSIVGHELIYRNDSKESYAVEQTSPTTVTASATATTDASTTTTTSATLPKPFSQIPSPRGLPFIGTLFDFIRMGGSSKLHEYSLYRHNQLGPIFMDNIGGSKVLFVADTALYRDVQKYEGIFPASLKPDSFHLYNKNNANPLCGLFIMEGEEWWYHRKKSHPSLLKNPPEFSPEMLSSFEDFVTFTMKRWEGIIQTNSGQLVNPEREIAVLGYEGLSHILFGHRFRPNWEKMNTDMSQALAYARDVVAGMNKLLMFPPVLAKKFRSRTWTDFESSLSNIMKLMKEVAELCVDDLKSYKPEEGYRQGGLLYKLSSETDFDRKALIDIIIGLVSPVDPPSATITWILWTLGRHPEVQEKIYEEINQVCGQGTPVLATQLQELGYVKMVLKEALRLKPTTPFIARVLPTDSVIGGYAVPAGQVVTLSIYASHLDAKHFPEPLKFSPERWSRGGSEGSNETQRYSSLTGVTDPSAYIPFGIGKRACVGKVIARSMLYHIIARTVQTFKIESNDVGINMKALMLPDRPLNIRLTKRVSAP